MALEGAVELAQRERRLGVAEAVMRADRIERRRGMALGQHEAVAMRIVDARSARNSVRRRRGRREDRRTTARRPDGRNPHDRSMRWHACARRRAASASCFSRSCAGAAEPSSLIDRKVQCHGVLLCRLARARAAEKIGIENDFGVGRQAADFGGDLAAQSRATSRRRRRASALRQRFRSGERAAMALADMGLQMLVDQQGQASRRRIVHTSRASRTGGPRPTSPCAAAPGLSSSAATDVSAARLRARLAT